VQTEVPVSRSAIIVDIAPTAVQSLGPISEADKLPPVVQYLIALAGVALAAAVGMGLQTVVPAANLTLLFVLPVIGMAVAFGWGPSMCAAVCGALAFDFFFTEPRYSLAIASLADIWSASLLLVVGAAVSTLAAQLRRRALEARRSAAQAKALQDLAHIVVMGAPRTQILEAAARTLNQIFAAPVALLRHGPEAMEVIAAAGEPSLSAADKSAANTALDLNSPTHGGAYPTDRARFDFWPVRLANGETLAVGVNFTLAPEGHPQDLQRHVEAVCGYLTAAFR
jgi:K+-sensing histidine kinase KdpD